MLRTAGALKKQRAHRVDDEVERRRAASGRKEEKIYEDEAGPRRGASRRNVTMEQAARCDANSDETGDILNVGETATQRTRAPQFLRCVFDLRRLWKEEGHYSENRVRSVDSHPEHITSEKSVVDLDRGFGWNICGHRHSLNIFRSIRTSLF